MSVASGVRPTRGEIWMAKLGMPVGHEQGGRRPVLIVSGRSLNGAPSRLVTVVPFTTRERGIRSHIRFDPGATGLTRISFARTDQHRVVSQDRLEYQMGFADAATMAAVETWLRIFLEL
jgi:mRNA interferase MazF